MRRRRRTGMRRSSMRNFSRRIAILRYVNAGHNPPIVLRGTPDDSQILRLEEGGTVLGLFPDFPYTEAQIQLESGDILVAFTDGISEAMNSAEEEFDEERLIEAIRKLRFAPGGRNDRPHPGASGCIHRRRETAR